MVFFIFFYMILLVFWCRLHYDLCKIVNPYEGKIHTMQLMLVQALNDSLSKVKSQILEWNGNSLLGQQAAVKCFFVFFFFLFISRHKDRQTDIWLDGLKVKMLSFERKFFLCFPTNSFDFYSLTFGFYS